MHPQSRVPQPRTKLGQRHQHKATEMHPRVGNVKIRLGHDFRAVQEQIDIHDPCLSRFPRPRAAAGFLHLQDALEELLGAEGGFYLHHAVKKPPSGHIHRFRLIERGDAEGSDSGTLREEGDGMLQCPPPIPQVCTETEIGPDHSSRPLSPATSYHLRFPIRCTASRIRSTGTVRAARINPSPCGPKPTPGVVTIPASLRRRATSSVELYPGKTGIQT